MLLSSIAEEFACASDPLEVRGSATRIDASAIALNRRARPALRLKCSA